MPSLVPFDPPEQPPPQIPELAGAPENARRARTRQPDWDVPLPTLPPGTVLGCSKCRHNHQRGCDERRAKVGIVFNGEAWEFQA